MKIRIYMGFFRRVIYKRRMKQMRFYLKNDNGVKYYQRRIDNKDEYSIKEVKKFCRVRFLGYSLIDDSMERSSSYRTKFFKERKGIFGSNIYVCAYCGRFMHKRKTKVDHIVSVYKAGNVGIYRKILALRGIKNVNDIRNLAPSCNKCNARKSSYGGFWVIRGMFGRSWLRVILKEFVLIILGGITLYWLYFQLRHLADYYNIIGYLSDIINN